MGQCLVMTYELVCNEVLRNITETSQGSWDTILTPRSIQESGWFSGIQTRTLVRTPDTDRLTLRGNVDRDSSDDRGVSHIHHTSINPHTAIVACTMNKYIRTHFKGNPSKESPSDRNNSALSWVVHSPGLSSAPWSRMKTTRRIVEKMGRSSQDT